MHSSAAVVVFSVIVTHAAAQTLLSSLTSHGLPVCHEAQHHAASLLQVMMKDPIRTQLVDDEVKISSAIASAAQFSLASSATAVTKGGGVEAWLFLLNLGPVTTNLNVHVKDRLPAVSDEASGLSSTRTEVSVIVVCNIFCTIFICLWAWNQCMTPSLRKIPDSKARVSGELDIAPIMGQVSTDCPESTSSAESITGTHFRNEDELLEVFSDLPLGWRHISMIVVAALGFCGAGGLNDTIGLSFASLEEEWGPQASSRLACLSLISTTGQILASLFVGHIADLKGRCFVSRFASLLIAFCCGLGAIAPSLEILALARFIGGMGYGSLNVVIPTLLSECVPTKSKYLLVLYQFGWPAGAGLFTFIMSTYGWRVAYVAFLPGASLILGVFWCPWGLPESPKWLCSQGRLMDASEAVAKFGFSPSYQPASENDQVLSPQAAASDAPAESQVAQSFYILVCFSMLCVSSASMLIKVWLPQVLTQRGVHSPAMAFVTMWAVEAVALFCSAMIFGSPVQKRGSNSNLSLLRVSQGALLLSGSAVLCYFQASSSWLITVTGILHLLGQSNASNFLMAFATLSFPVTVRARCVAGVFLASYAGCFVGPVIGAVLLQNSSPLLGAYCVLSVAGVTYAFGLLGAIGLERHKLDRDESS